MNLYQLTYPGAEWDQYNGCVVAAEDENAARRIHPKGYENTTFTWEWCAPEEVVVVLIGTACEGTKSGVILASYQAG